LAVSKVLQQKLSASGCGQSVSNRSLLCCCGTCTW